MKYFTFGKKKSKISCLGLGALHFGVLLNLKETTNLVDYAIDNGINFIDTAPLYGNGTLRNFLKDIIKKREKLIIATKFGLKKF